MAKEKVAIWVPVHQVEGEGWRPCLQNLAYLTVEPPGDSHPCMLTKGNLGKRMRYGWMKVQGTFEVVEHNVTKQKEEITL